MLKKLFNNLWDNAYQGNNHNIISLLEHNPTAKFLDLGCNDGAWTNKCAKKLGEDNSFDVIHANQVIEHLYDTEKFMLEINRLCKSGGVIVLSTENASSWHNIFALMLGWQMFSLTNICSSGGIGNPLAIHRGETQSCKPMEHIRIFAYRGLVEYVEKFGFKVESILCSGYYPLPNWFAKIDPRHGHFITIKAIKIAEV